MALLNVFTVCVFESSQLLQFLDSFVFGSYNFQCGQNTGKMKKLKL